MVNEIVSLILLSHSVLLVYRNTTNSCLLILHPEILFHLLMSSSSFLVVSLDFLFILSGHLQTMLVLLLPFQFSFLNFFFFSLLWLGLLKLCWLKVIRMGILVLFQVLEKIFQLFTIEYNVICGFVIYGLYYVEVYSLYAHVPESFYSKWMVSFVKSLFCNYWDDHMIFILQFVIMMYHIHWFADTEKSLHPWDKSHLIILYHSSNVLLDSVCWILLMIFTCTFTSDIDL